MTTKARTKKPTTSATPSLDYILGVARGLLVEVERDVESENEFQLTYGGADDREAIAKRLGIPVLLVDAITRNVMPADLAAWVAWEHRDAVQRFLEENVKDKAEVAEGGTDGEGAAA